MSSGTMRRQAKPAVWEPEPAPATTRVVAASHRTILAPTASGKLVEVPVPTVRSVHSQLRPDGVKPKRVVIHCTENAELRGMARMNANLFAGPKSPEASFHYVLDDREVIQCVPEHLKAWHAPGVNDESVGIEIVGRASQTSTMWSDDYSRAELYLAMGLVADVCRRWLIPVQFVDREALLCGVLGITTHRVVTSAYPKVGHGHTDPGPSFPMDALLQGVRWTLMKMENAAVPTD